MSIGIVFVSTGGNKLLRAVRSLRRTEPKLPVHVVLDTASRTYNQNRELNFRITEEVLAQPYVQIRDFQNQRYINGCLNEGMRWMKELGHNHGCLFHDDVIFSSLSVHKGWLMDAFDRYHFDAELHEASGVSLGYMQAFCDKQVWKRSPEAWDSTDLESETLWQDLCPNGWPFGFWDGGEVPERQFLKFLAQCYVVPKPRKISRLGPPSQIVPIDTWESVGGFDEEYGVFYDEDYPAACAVKGLPPIMVMPSIPHLHLHNQSIGYADPADNLYSDHGGAFERKFGKTVQEFWLDRHNQEQAAQTEA